MTPCYKQIQCWSDQCTKNDREDLCRFLEDHLVRYELHNALEYGQVHFDRSKASDRSILCHQFHSLFLKMYKRMFKTIQTSIGRVIYENLIQNVNFHQCLLIRIN